MQTDVFDAKAFNEAFGPEDPAVRQVIVKEDMYKHV